MADLPACEPLQDLSELAAPHDAVGDDEAEKWRDELAGCRRDETETEDQETP